MSFVNVDFTYMPGGSFTILPDDTIYFREGKCTEEQKARMLREWPAYLERMKEKHLSGNWMSTDMASGLEPPRENWEATAEHAEELLFPWLIERRRKKEAEKSQKS